MPQCSDHLGNLYPSMASMAKAYKLLPKTLEARLARGWNLRKALTTPAQSRRTGCCADHLGQKYPDMKSMAKAYNINYGCLKSRLNRGWSIELALSIGSVPHPSTVCYDHIGYEYPSRTAMAREYGISANTLQKRLNKGVSLKQALTLMNSRVVKDHLGKKYKSKAAMLNAYGVPRNTFDYRIAAGASLEDALTAEPKSLRRVDGEYRQLQDSQGNTYRNLQEMCDALGISVSAYHTRRRLGIPVEQPNRVHSVTDHEGKEYPTLQAMLDAYKLNRGTYQRRKKNGWTQEECLLGRKKENGRVGKSAVIENEKRLKQPMKERADTQK